MGKETWDHGTPKGWFVKPYSEGDGTLVLSVVMVIRPKTEWEDYTPGAIVTDKEFRVPHKLPWWMFWEPDFDTRAAEAFELAKKRVWELNSAIQRSTHLCYKFTHPPQEKPNAAESE